MSRLEELIQELCPNGVEYKPLWFLTIWDKKFNSVDRHKQTKVIKYKYYLAADLKGLESQTGDVKILTTSISDLWTTEEYVKDTMSEGEIVCIPWGGNPVVQYYSGKFVTGDNRIATSANTSVLSNKFLYYFMQNSISDIASFYRGSGIKHPDMAKVLDLMIPVPPLEVQREIVRILDSFTLLTAELTAELTARKKQYEYYRDELLKPKANIPMVRLDVQKRYSEVLDNFEKICNDLNIGLPAEIEARQKQYEFYRDALLTYAETGKIILTDKQTDEYNALIRLCQYVFGFVMLPLSEICNSISSGKAKTKDDIGKYPVYGSTGIIARTDNAIYNKMNILVARVGANAGYTHLAQGGYDVSDNTLIVDVKNEYSLKYIYYQLVNIGLNRYAKGGGQPLVTAGQIKEVVLPVPMKQEQDRIVDILDRFDSLCNDITTGLPAEIEARQKQYEFYRDKLLSFKQL